MFVLIGLAVALLIAGVLSFYASSSPDGLESAAEDTGFGDSAQESVTGGSPLAGYGVSGVDSDRLSVGLAGVIGVLMTLMITVGLTTLIQRRRASQNAGRNATVDSPSDA